MEYTCTHTPTHTYYIKSGTSVYRHTAPHHFTSTVTLPLCSPLLSHGTSVYRHTAPHHFTSTVTLPLCSPLLNHGTSVYRHTLHLITLLVQSLYHYGHLCSVTEPSYIYYTGRWAVHKLFYIGLSVWFVPKIIGHVCCYKQFAR